MKRIVGFVLLVFCVSAFVFAQGGGSTKMYKIGEVEFVAIKDTDTNMSKSILLNPDAEIVKKLMPQGQAAASINTFLVKTKNNIVLIDTGLGGNGGKTVENLKSLGINPQDINIILITHMHNDHIGGLVRDGKKVFSKAKVYIAKEEFDYWTNRPSSTLAQDVKKVYGSDIKFLTWDKNIIPEIQAIKAVGHTPGHTIFEISSQDDKILVVGDIIHSLKVQTADPSMSVTFDTDPDQAAKTREAVLKYAAEKKIKIAGMHIPFSGVGKVSKEVSSGYLFRGIEK